MSGQVTSSAVSEGALTLQVTCPDRAEPVSVRASSQDDLPPLRNPQLLVGANDLTSLSYLHEPAGKASLKS